ncbi:PREDICTED: RING finger protein 222 [Myotis davidii]|uniref:RING finger protein 222 n=1 Tax=Myotis davidii TaxID=225400 RepID=UPI0003EC69B5|nr:PREDICTED: RING finger protein 222 [Myotis davidii]
MSEGESKDSSGSECPVCYEKFRDLEGASRTLSCGHVFCHDCLVKYLLSTRVDGQVQRTIVCPICRYVTFLSKKSSRWPSRLDKSAPPAPRSTRSFCCRSRALLLITLIAVVAVVAAILPWVLLVRKQA